MRQNLHILVAGDESPARAALLEYLASFGHIARAVPDGPAAIRALDTEAFDAVLLDGDSPGVERGELLRRLREISPGTAAVLLAARPSVASVVSAMREGASDVLEKPVDFETLHSALARIGGSAQHAPEEMASSPCAVVKPAREAETIVGRSPAMRKVFSLIRTVSGTATTVLVTGETGTGKELVARAIHANSPRRYGPFIAVSCGALPETLLESELFGYEKGAFTGADRTKKGRFELAHGGTLFLDEIGDIGPQVQMKLLRVLQERSFNRLGGVRPVDVDVRVITATNRDLDAGVKAGSFRSDLFYRLNVVNIHLPALRERRDDIPLLAERFMERFNAEFGKHFKGIDKRAMELMTAYPWPGNVRELENVIERAVVIDPGPVIRAGLLPFCGEVPPPAPAGIEDSAGEPLTLLEAERNHIVRMLERCGWNIAGTARVLGIDRTTLHKKINRYGIDTHPRKGAS